MKISRGKIILVLVLMSISISVLLYSFAYTTVTHTGNITNYLTVSDISFGLVDSVESINLGEVTPTLDKFGLLNESFSFSIVNSSSSEQRYTVRLIDKMVSTISNSDIRYQLTRNGVVGDIKELSPSGAIDAGSIEGSGSIDYSIKVWLKYDAEIENGSWDKVVKVEAGSVNIDSSGANEPMLLDNMIPVYYDNDNNVWRKADSLNADVNYQWYDYDARKWANAVTVTNTNLANYLDDTITPTGTEISMSDITNFFVWIPRFKYNTFESGSPKIVDVTFEKGISSTGSGNSITHPAFSFNGEETTGFWVSKFELSPEENTACYSNVSSSNCNKNNLALVSKPNLKSLYYITASNLFKSIRNMEIDGNIHGFINGGSSLNDDGTGKEDSNNYDIHLIKSFENGALTYLTYSKYGKFGNDRYDLDNKYIFSNNSNTLTGSSYVDGVSYNYNIDYYGTGASTTGNIYGVYDLNGLVKEFVMGNVLNSGGSFIEYSSGFSSLNSRYYDAYPYTSSSTGISGIDGDAITDFVGFESGSSTLPYSSYPFLLRESGTKFNRSTGTYASNVGGRSVISVEQDIYLTK